MPHPKFGQRFTCFQCGSKFYDMNKAKPICPKCEANQLKVPKKSSVKAPKRQPVAIEELDPEETPSADHEEKEIDISEDLADLPVQGAGDSFEHEADNPPLAVGDLPDDSDDDAY